MVDWAKRVSNLRASVFGGACSCSCPLLPCPADDIMLTISTGRSWGAFLYGIIEIFVSSAVTYCDQASWQSRIAAKPVQGVWGFLLAGFIWFSIPNVMAVTTGMAYLALSSNNGSHLLMPSEIDEGQHGPFLSLPPVLPSVLTL